MRRIPRLLAIVPASLLLAVPAGAAHASAAKANPWSAYIPAKGVTCTMTSTNPDGTTDTEKDTVLSKSATKVVSHVTGTGRVEDLLLPGGKLRETQATTVHVSAWRMRFASVANYPSPTQLLHHRSGSGQVTVVATLPTRMAKTLLKSGRTMTLTGAFRITGLGSQSITLPAATPGATPTTVDALGLRYKLRSIKAANVKPAFAHELIKQERPVFAMFNESEWLAKGLGTVQESVNEGGTTLTATQTGCS